MTGKADGDFGPKTEQALKAHQQAVGLPITGECDFYTYQRMDSDMQAEAAIPKPTPEPAVEKPIGQDYIYNKNLKKSHETWCSSVKQMKEKNKGYFSGDRQDLINKGYQPCKKCKP